MGMFWKKKKNNQPPITAVLKANLDCNRCTAKIINRLHEYPGIDKVKAEREATKFTVTGTVDPFKLRDKLAKAAKRDVALVYEPPVTTVMLKIEIGSDRSFVKIRNVLRSFKDVTPTFDRETELFKLVGVVDMPKIQAKLKKKVKKTAEIVQPWDDHRDTYGMGYVHGAGYCGVPVYAPQLRDDNPNACSIM